MDWMTDGQWGFAGVILGILLTTVFGFMKSLVERRWTRQDQLDERLFEHRQAAHLAMLLTLNQLDAWRFRGAGADKSALRKAIAELEPSVAALNLYCSSRARMEAEEVLMYLKAWEDGIDETDPPEGNPESRGRFEDFRYTTWQYHVAARIDLGVDTPRRRLRERLNRWAGRMRFKFQLLVRTCPWCGRKKALQVSVSRGAKTRKCRWCEFGMTVLPYGADE